MASIPGFLSWLICPQGAAMVRKFVAASFDNTEFPHHQRHRGPVHRGCGAHRHTSDVSAFAEGRALVTSCNMYKSAKCSSVHLCSSKLTQLFGFPLQNDGPPLRKFHKRKSAVMPVCFRKPFSLILYEFQLFMQGFKSLFKVSSATGDLYSTHREEMQQWSKCI